MAGDGGMCERQIECEKGICLSYMSLTHATIEGFLSLTHASIDRMRGGYGRGRVCGRDRMREADGM